MKKKVLSALCGLSMLMGVLSLGTTNATAQSIDPGDDSCPTGGAPNKNCPYWNVTVTFGMWPTISCTTGGEFTCSG